MGKTPEQSKADDMLEEAVTAVVKAYSLTPSGSVMTDYMVLGEAVKWHDDGEECDIFAAFRNGHCRLTTALGIIELGRRHVIGHWTDDGRKDEPEN